MRRKLSRVLFIISSLINGGGERVVSILTGSLAECGIEVHLMIYDTHPNEYEISKYVTVHRLPDRYGNPIKKKLHKFLWIRKTVNMIKPDVIYSFLENISFWACMGFSYPYISTIRVNPASSPQGVWARKYRDALCALSKGIFVQNNAQKNYFPRRLHHKIIVVPNPVSDNFLDFRRNYSAEPSRIVTLGRLLPRKNQKLLMDAFARLAAKNSKLQLYIYGAGPESDALQKYADSIPYTSRIHMMGRTGDALEALSGADIFALTSDFEGMPNTLMEAMATGLPCVSTDCDTGPADLINDGENGYLVHVRDPEEMACSIAKLIESPEDAMRMGRNAKKSIAESYSSRKVACELIDKTENLQWGIKRKGVLNMCSMILKKLARGIFDSPSGRIKRARESGVKIGSGCEIYEDVSFGGEPYLIKIGNNVRITRGVKFITHDGGIWVLRNNGMLRDGDIFGRINIGNNVHIGINSIIMPNVTIGDNVIVGVGAVVTKDIPSNSIAAGVPAKVIKSLQEYYEKHKDSVDFTKHMGWDEKRSYLIKKYDLNFNN